MTRHLAACVAVASYVAMWACAVLEAIQYSYSCCG